MNSGDKNQFGFDCPNCGDTTVVHTDKSPDEFVNSIYRCGGCDEKILLDNYRNDRTVNSETEQ
jgi:predicted SprT family Zn-dependent metalloprotease